jgi:hypothetical protein
MPPAIDLARRYAEALAALRAVHIFDDWLGHFWHERCPRPDGAPTSSTPVTREDAIVWHEREDIVIGYLPGEDGCFRIPRAAPLPDFPSASNGPSVSFGQDVVISAAMREELQPPQ